MNKQPTESGNPGIRRTGPVTAEDLKHVSEDDFADLQRMARGYCRTVDATRSRKRMDGSATAARGGRALYGTDDVSDDVTQEAVLIFAKRLREIIETCEVAAVWVATREPCAWQYVRRDGETTVVTRKKIQYWAVRDAAARNGYRIDGKPDAAQGNRIPHAEKLSTLAAAPYFSGLSQEIFDSVWGDGSEYPTLSVLLAHANEADNIGRARIMGEAAQELYGGPLNSSSKVQRLRDVARKEWRALSADLDAARDELIYRSMQQKGE
ncbi:hypothetical protein IAG44_39955 [Streptomyces roseirectus]|uniref:Uncharacterized protein n=1 Tax=Streptomyces roseirectus TaxID=2768066 RepID=A0A7H0IQC1_9ACTN|nr:hypothetical protein [Streptomyces roseirectus]QNP74987.1 hypothetical protein IAG44_39955 [Streptomyces roseirectus]